MLTGPESDEMEPGPVINVGPPSRSENHKNVNIFNKHLKIRLFSSKQCKLISTKGQE
jgi:hypothetical protein